MEGDLSKTFRAYVYKMVNLSKSNVCPREYSQI